jgi:hypothetical protein
VNSFGPSCKRFFLVALFFVSVAKGGTVGSTRPEFQVSPCPHITLSASYLAELRVGQGSSFHFRLSNDTSNQIRLAKPVPTSAHWFTRDGQHWYWRASAGGGGSLVDAMSPNGKMFVYRATRRVEASQILEVPPHSVVEWEQGAKENPVLEFKPGCAMCSHPDDREFRGIFAYAYLPMPEDKSLGLLPCGIRSTPVDLPPIR